MPTISFLSCGSCGSSSLSLVLFVVFVSLSFSVLHRLHPACPFPLSCKATMKSLTSYGSLRPRPIYDSIQLKQSRLYAQQLIIITSYSGGRKNSIIACAIPRELVLFGGRTPSDDLQSLKIHCTPQVHNIVSRRSVIFSN